MKSSLRLNRHRKNSAPRSGGVLNGAQTLSAIGGGACSVAIIYIVPDQSGGVLHLGVEIERLGTLQNTFPIKPPFKIKSLGFKQGLGFGGCEPFGARFRSIGRLRTE